jgi:hypothetical protein
MNLLLGALKNMWHTFYNNYIYTMTDKTKMTVGIVCILISCLVFVMCTKGHDKSKMVNSWFLFWISLLSFVVGVLFLSYF